MTRRARAAPEGDEEAGDRAGETLEGDEEAGGGAGVDTSSAHESATAADAQRLGSARRRRCQESTNIEEVRRVGGVYIKRRANGRMVAHTILPRILKSDIRRSYPQMICNIDNINDPRLFMDFLTTFTVPTTIFQSTAHQNVQGSDMPHTLTMVGPDPFVQSWKQLGELTPDKASRLLSAQVLARSDGTGEVHYVVEFCGSMLVTCEEPKPWRHVDLQIDQFIGSPEVVGWISGGDDRHVQTPPARRFTMINEVSAVLRLDAANRILRIDLWQGVPRFSEEAVAVT